MRTSSSVAVPLIEEEANPGVKEWADLVASWVTYLQAEDKSDATVITYRHAVTRKFLPFLIEIGWNGGLGGLTPEHFRHWLNSLKAEGCSGATRLLYRQAARSFFRFLKEEGEIAEGRSVKLSQENLERHVYKKRTPGFKYPDEM